MHQITIYDHFSCKHLNCTKHGFLEANYVKSIGSWGSAPDPDGGAYSTPPYPPPPPLAAIERLQCHPGKSGGHVFWCLQFCYRMFPICNRIFTTCNRTRDTKKHGRRSSRDDTATSRLYPSPHEKFFMPDTPLIQFLYPPLYFVPKKTKCSVWQQLRATEEGVLVEKERLLLEIYHP